MRRPTASTGSPEFSGGTDGLPEGQTQGAQSSSDKLGNPVFRFLELGCEGLQVRNFISGQARGEAPLLFTFRTSWVPCRINPVAPFAAAGVRPGCHIVLIPEKLLAGFEFSGFDQAVQHLCQFIADRHPLFGRSLCLSPTFNVRQKKGSIRRVVMLNQTGVGGLEPCPG